MLGVVNEVLFPTDDRAGTEKGLSRGMIRGKLLLTRSEMILHGSWLLHCFLCKSHGLRSEPCEVGRGLQSCLFERAMLPFEQLSLSSLDIATFDTNHPPQMLRNERGHSKADYELHGEHLALLI